MDIHIDTSQIVIETERLILRAFTEADLSDFYAYASVPGVGEMAGWPHHQSIETSEGILRSFIEEKEVFAVFHKAANKVIGSFGLHKSWANEDERYKNLKAKKIGYVLSKDFWGQGLMPEAVSAVINYGFNTLGIEAFTCEHFLENNQSRRVIEKTGFVFVEQGEYYSKLLDKTFEDMKYILIHDTKRLNLDSTSKTNEWRKKLDVFISGFEYIDDVVGILVCGSYITGNPTSHSDLDVHIVLDNVVGYRERGNKIIDDLLIEYFANPPKQILRYFDEDFREMSLMAQTQFATGEIILDKTGDVAALKEKATVMISEFYSTKRDNYSATSLDKYGLWDMMDDLQDAYENQRADFDFVYFNCLNRLIECYMRYVNLPYNAKTIYGNIVDGEIRKKYLLRELPDSDIKNLIIEAIIAIEQNKKIETYEKLTTTIINKFGGFNIDGFKFKSNVEE